MVSEKECTLYTSPTTLVQLLVGFTICDKFKLGVMVNEKDFSVETIVVGLLDIMVLLIGWSVT